MSTFWQKKSEILGVNARNLLYINRYNTRLGKSFADDKIFTKNYLQSRGIGVARLYATLRSHKELENFNPDILPDSFVIKPNHGYGGEGILIIKGRRDKFYVGSGNRRFSWQDLHDECTAILDGKYSFSGFKDQVIFEELLVTDDYFLDYVDHGLPDIRIVVFNLVPVMAMLRMPTPESGGRANLHMGAVGLGIDIGTGEVTSGVYHNKPLKVLPNGKSITSIKIPKWDEMLLSASKIQQISKVGFVGVDLTLAKTGIKVLEINARAGLNIQIANAAPLKLRLNKVADLDIAGPEEAISIAKTLFTKSKKKAVKSSKSDKPIIGLYENIEILNTTFSDVKAKVDPHATRNLADKSFQEQIGDRIMSIKLAGKRINIPVEYGDLEKHNYKVILAGKSLKEFLIDISSEPKPVAVHTKTNGSSKEEKIIKNIDRKIFEIDKKLGILPRLRPINLDQEKQMFMQNPSYSPKFIYKKMAVDFDYIKKEIKKIPEIDHPLMPLYDAKIKEMQRKIALLESRGSSKIQYYSEKIYGRVTKELFQEANDIIGKFKMIEDESEKVPFKKIVKTLHDFLKENKIHHWKIKILDNATADISVGKNNFIYLKDGVEFTENRLKSVVAHEIETHVYRLENARLQPYKIFEQGTTNYLTTEEGLAIYNQRKLNLASGKKPLWPSLNLIAIYLGRKMSFAELAAYMMDKYGISQEEAWKVCVKVKRGLANTETKASFSRDFIYFEGFKMVNEYVKKNGNDGLKKLYAGKISINDLEVLNQVDSIKVKYVPRYLK